MSNVVKIGFAPTKRVPFNHPETFEVRDEIRSAIAEWSLNGAIEIVDIDDVTPKNILETEDDVIAVAEKFKKEKVDGIFFPHCNFGCEAAVAGVARQFDVPILLWGREMRILKLLQQPAIKGVRAIRSVDSLRREKPCGA
ncbi:MAG: hypothetical protein ACOX3W_05695 [Christensenellaceae bacterium]|jgi:L-fucose isomerase-like protein